MAVLFKYIRKKRQNRTRRDRLRGIAKVALIKREKSKNRRVGKFRKSSKMSGKAEKPEEVQKERSPEPAPVYTQLEVRKVENVPVVEEDPIIPPENYEYDFQTVDEVELEEGEYEEIEEREKKHWEISPLALNSSFVVVREERRNARLGVYHVFKGCTVKEEECSEESLIADGVQGFVYYDDGPDPHTLHVEHDGTTFLSLD